MRLVAHVQIFRPDLLRVGCRLGAPSSSATHAVVAGRAALLGPGRDRSTSTGSPSAPLRFKDLYGNVCRRLDLAAETSSFAYDATVADLARARGDARRATTSSTASRSSRPSSCTGCCRAACASRISSLIAPGSCSARRRAAPSGSRPSATGSTSNVEYGVPSVPTTTVGEMLERTGRHVPRLRAPRRDVLPRARHSRPLRVRATCPTSASPARIRRWTSTPGSRSGSASSWWTYDARFNTPRIGRVPIGRGRDAIDVAMVTTYGAATLETMRVWADEVEPAAGWGSRHDR